VVTHLAEFCKDIETKFPNEKEALMVCKKRIMFLLIMIENE